MKKIAGLSLLTLISLSACFEVQKLEISEDLQEKLDMSKPTIINPAEVNGVACEIGDSIFKTLNITSDTSFSLGNHAVRVFGESTSTDSLLKSKFEAFAYSFESDSTFKPKGVVKYAVKDTVAYYENATRLPNNEIKFTHILIDLSEVNLKVVHDRKKLKQKNK